MRLSGAETGYRKRMSVMTSCPVALFIAAIIRPLRWKSSLRTTLLFSPTYMMPSRTLTDVVALFTVGPMTVCHSVCARCSSMCLEVPFSFKTSSTTSDSFFDVSSGMTFFIGGFACSAGRPRSPCHGPL